MPWKTRDDCNVLERAAILAEGASIRPEVARMGHSVRTVPGTDSIVDETLANVERVAIQRALALTSGNR